MFKLTRSTPGCFLVASVTNADLMMTSIAKVSLHSSVGCWWGWGLPDEGRNWESEEKIWAWEPGAPGTARSSAAQLLSFIGWHGVTLTTGGGHHGQHWWSLVSVFSVLTCVVTLCRDVNSSRVTMLPSPRPTDDWLEPRYRPHCRHTGGYYGLPGRHGAQVTLRGAQQIPPTLRTCVHFRHLKISG